MIAFDRTLPPALADAHREEFDYADGEGIDFEPYDQFQPADENADWIQAWTGNKELAGAEYRIFGQDGTGGYAMFWLTRAGQPMTAQPIVFFGSEGEVGIVARNLDDYLWMLADGVGPKEAVEISPTPRQRNAAFAAIAERHAPAAKKSSTDVVAAARAEFPDFEQSIRALCAP